MKKVLTLLALFVVLPQSSCVAVGYSSSGGWFVWPGGLALIVLLIVVIFLVRRRR